MSIWNGPPLKPGEPIMQKITDHRTLDSYLSSIFEVGARADMHRRSLEEKEKQQAATPAPSSDDSEIDLFSDSGDDAGGDQAQEPKQQPGGASGVRTSKTLDSETEKLQGGNIETKDIVDKLNFIRSGRSFKDSAVSTAIDQYVTSLSKAEKVALLAFLKGIGQIVTGEIPAQQAVEPDSKPANVDMQKAHAEKKHLQPNVIKAQQPKQKNGGGSEDASGPVPITPKKKG